MKMHGIVTLTVFIHSKALETALVTHCGHALRQSLHHQDDCALFLPVTPTAKGVVVPFVK
jgi:hypothetical protein